jgi:rhamnosyl/mannosyltransferase
MACGKPVISTDLPTGVPFINQHRQTGIIVSPKESLSLAAAIDELIEDPSLAAQYGETGRQRVREEFTLELMLKRVLGLYREVTAIGSGG